jgi:hypothetical protein
MTASLPQLARNRAPKVVVIPPTDPAKALAVRVLPVMVDLPAPHNQPINKVTDTTIITAIMIQTYVGRRRVVTFNNRSSENF